MSTGIGSITWNNEAELQHGDGSPVGKGHFNGLSGQEPTAPSPELIEEYGQAFRGLAEDLVYDDPLYQAIENLRDLWDSYDEQNGAPSAEMLRNRLDIINKAIDVLGPPDENPALKSGGQDNTFPEHVP